METISSAMASSVVAFHEHTHRTTPSLFYSSSSSSSSFSSSNSLQFRSSRRLRVGLKGLPPKLRLRALPPMGRRTGRLEVASLLIEFHPPPEVSQLNGLPSQVLNNSVEAKQQTFSSFDDLLKNSDKPVLVDFYATWCGPCQFMVPVLNQVGESMKDQIQIVKIDTEKYPVIADKYNIQALPTFIMFKDGKPCDRFEGAMAADKLIKRIEAALEVKQQ